MGSGPNILGLTEDRSKGKGGSGETVKSSGKAAYKAKARHKTHKQTPKVKKEVKPGKPGKPGLPGPGKPKPRKP